jgi:hypothetical protein
MKKARMKEPELLSKVLVLFGEKLLRNAIAHTLYA